MKGLKTPENFSAGTQESPDWKGKKNMKIHLPNLHVWVPCSFSRVVFFCFLVRNPYESCGVKTKLQFNIIIAP